MKDPELDLLGKLFNNYFKGIITPSKLEILVRTSDLGSTFVTAYTKSYAKKQLEHVEFHTVVLESPKVAQLCGFVSTYIGHLKSKLGSNSSLFSELNVRGFVITWLTSYLYELNLGASIIQLDKNIFLVDSTIFSYKAVEAED
jgi:hypothetical protein